MKQINSFLLERLKLTSKTKLPKTGYSSDWNCTTETVEMPQGDSEDYKVYQNKKWKTMTLPLATYVIFKDKYRGDRPHFADLGDMLCNIYVSFSDYEQFNPDKDILYASDDLKDILEWYFKYCGATDLPTRKNLYDWVEKWEDTLKGNHYEGMLDNPQVMAEVYVGKDDWFDGCSRPISIQDELYNILGSYLDIV